MSTRFRLGLGGSSPSPPCVQAAGAAERVLAAIAKRRPL